MDLLTAKVLIVSLIFAPGTMFSTKVDGELRVQGSCKQIEDGLRKEFVDKGVKIVELACQQQEVRR